MSRLTTFAKHDYSICTIFEPDIYRCLGCYWHVQGGQGCTVPPTLYRMDGVEISEFVEAICLD